MVNFLACPLVEGVNTFPSFQMTFTRLNICAYLGGKMSPMTHLYFDPALYPPPPPGETLNLNQHEHWLNLKRDLMVASHKEGNPICSNSYTRDKTSRTFFCSCFWSVDTASSTSPQKYCSTSLVANFKNARKHGQSMPRRRHTRVGEEPCPFFFTVTWDTHCFYVVLSKCSGNPEHARHFK